MTVIETNGIIYLEHLAEQSEWYCGTDYACGDLYEAEEIFAAKGAVKPNRVIFVHHPEGRLAEPICLEQNQYFGRPAQIDGIIYILIVDFGRQLIRVMDCGSGFERIIPAVELPLGAVKDCYNLLLHGSPLMLTRQSSDVFEVVWPQKTSFTIEAAEAFLYREGEQLVFSKWMEDPDYREEIVTRDWAGRVLSRAAGSLFITPGGEKWLLR